MQNRSFINSFKRLNPHIDIRSVLLGFFFIFLCSQSNAKVNIFGNNDVDPKKVEKKADFIGKVAENVSTVESKSKKYRIGIYGRSAEAKLLFEVLSNRKLTFQGKKVEVLQFKRMMNVEDIDLLYLNHNSKINLSKLYEKIRSNCILVTENFPYGQSPINFFMNDDASISYVIEENQLNKSGISVGGSLKSGPNRITSKTNWASKLLEAKEKIKAQDSTIKEQSDSIHTQQFELGENYATISEQRTTLQEKSLIIQQSDKIIRQQKALIWSIVIGILLALILSYFLYRMFKRVDTLLKENQEKTKEIVASITYAERIQRASLPSHENFTRGLNDVFIHYVPKDIISGDFYWLEESGDIIYFAVADCTGHGVPGAMLTVLCSNTLSRSINELGMTEPSKILDFSVGLLEEFFAKSDDKMNDGMDIVLCKLNKSKNTLEYAGANRPLLYFANGHLMEQKADRQPIGRHDNRTPYVNHKITLSEGDSIYLFSDGIVDQFGGPKGKKYTTKRLKKLLVDIHYKPMDIQKKILVQEVTAWQGKEDRIDDTCIIGVKIS
jgi:serine phosphatase RsbU (regulator of sigma subunit)